MVCSYLDAEYRSVFCRGLFIAPDDSQIGKFEIPPALQEAGGYLKNVFYFEIAVFSLGCFVELSLSFFEAVSAFSNWLRGVLLKGGIFCPGK